MFRNKIIISLACLISLSNMAAWAKGNVKAGEANASVCFTCHGVAGAKPVIPDAPILAGQYADYLQSALHAYKDGSRKNMLMKSQVEKLSKADMADLAAYFAAQPSPLWVKK